MILDLENLNTEQLVLLNKISSEIHGNFNDLVEQILYATPRDTVDLVGNILSRHPYQSNLFDVCVKLEFVRQYLLRVERIEIIYTSEQGIYNILKRKEYNIILTKKRNFISRLSLISKPFIDLLRITLIIKIELLTRNSSRKLRIKTQDSLTLIDTFLLQDSIDQKEFIDRYYTGILDYLEENETERIFFVPHIIGHYKKSDLLKIWLNSKVNLLFKNDFLKFIDYAEAFRLLFKQKIQKSKVFYFQGFDLTSYIRSNFKQEKFNTTTFQALLNYFFIMRLSYESINIHLFIDWNENQPIDKGIVKGVHDFYPNLKVKGYRAFIISHDYNLYLMPTQFEIDSKVIPDEIIVICNDLIDQVKAFSKNLIVSTGPAFRFMNIHNPVEKRLNIKLNILVALPIGIEDSIEVIRTLSRIAEKRDIERFHFIIKPHPTTPIKMLHNSIKECWNSNYTWATGDFRVNILQSWLFISNTSSSIIEALAYGVPVIIIGSKKSITQNPIPKTLLEEMWKLCYSDDEVYNAINYYANLPIVEMVKFQQWGESHKLNYFKPITQESVRNFLSPQV